MARDSSYTTTAKLLYNLANRLDADETVELSSSDIAAIRKGYRALSAIDQISVDLDQLSKDVSSNRSEWADGVRKAIQAIRADIEETIG